MTDIFLSAFSNLIFSLTAAPLMGYTLKHHSKWYFLVLAVSLLLQSAYNAWGFKGILVKKRAIAYWKVLLVAILNNLLWLLITIFFFIWFVYRSNTWMYFQGVVKYLAQ